MKTKLWSLLFAMLVSVTALAAGDIYEIVPCTEYGIKRAPYATLADPIKSVGSESYFFTIRLQVRNADSMTDPNAHGLKRYFRLNHINPLASEEYDASIEANRFGIGVFVSGKSTTSDSLVDSGKLEYARLVDIVPNTASVTNFFDCIFEYKLKPGHFALPVRLAVEDTDTITGKTVIRPEDMATDSSTYHFSNTDKWEVQYVDTEIASRSGKAVWSISAAETAPKTKPSGSSSYSRTGNDTLKAAGLYVQTVDFDRSIMEGADYWREVPMGDQIKCPVKAFAEASGVAEDTTLYVWSDDESAVKVLGGETVEIVTNKVGTTEYKKTVTIGTITMLGGTATADFNVLGVMSNKTAKIVLSPWKGYRFSTAGNTPEVDYTTIAIKCGPKPPPSVYISFDADYPAASSSKKLSVEASTNFNDRVQDRIPMYVTLSQPYAHDMDVQVKVTYMKDDTVDAITNNIVALAEHDDGFSPNDNHYTNITFKAGETQKEISLYALGGNAATKANGIRFEPVIPDPAAAAEYSTAGEEALLYIAAVHTPTIVKPKDEVDVGTVSGAAGEGFTIDEFLVNDVYRDLVNPAGFEVTFSSAFKGQASTNIVFGAEGSPVELLITGYDKKKEEVQTGTITVTEPADPLEPTKTRKSVKIQVRFKVAVEKDKLVYVNLYDSTESSSLHDGTIFNEGDAPIPMFYVNEAQAPGESLYFFLRPLNEASSNLVSCAAFTQGIELVGGQTNTTRSSAFALNFLDGRAITESTGSLEYEIFARTKPTLTEGEESILYSPAQKLVLNVANVKPTVQAVKINGASDSVADDPNAVWKHSVSAGVEVPFQAKLSDPSAKFDVKEGLVTVWYFSEGRSSNVHKYEFKRIDDGAEVITCNHKFNYAGGVTQDVKVVVLDKDMLAAVPGCSETYTPPADKIADLWTAVTDASKPYYAKPYQFRVAVGKRPSVRIAFPENGGKDTVVVDEDNTTGRMEVELTEAADEELKLKVTVASLHEGTKPGAFEFVTTELTVEEGNTEPKRTTQYKDGLLYKYGALDGTVGSSGDGFYVTVEVTTDCEHGKDYFEKAEGWIYVQNTPPELPSSTSVSTNNVAAGQPFEIPWSVKDVAIDLAAGIKARWYDNGAEIQSARQTVTTSDEIITTLTLNQDGLHQIRLEVTDKDGSDNNGMSSRTWYYYIEPTKKLKLRPVGPSSYTESYYDAAMGRGKGRVYADGTLGGIKSFVQTWSYGVSAAQAEFYATGYPSSVDGDGNPKAYADDGTLGDGVPKRDAALGPSGETYVSGPYYTYDGKYDNYFYRWFYILGGTSNEYSKVSIQTVSGEEAVAPQLTLDAYAENKVGYKTMEVEAIFSRELMTDDNLGDINADGIPDLYMRVYQFDAFNAKGELVGDDLGDHFVDWADGDYLPTTTNFTVRDSFGTTNTWALEGVPFDTVQEIRGMSDERTGEISHFNDAYQILAAGIGSGKAAALLQGVKSDLRFTDPDADDRSTLSKAEWLAYLAYCDKKGWTDPENPDHWGLQYDAATGRYSYDNSWSPERPTNPTLKDTDGDGMSDGFEYFLWYKSHVGDLEESGKLVRRTGRRYNVLRPMDPDPISADDIESIFDPLAKAVNVRVRDTDNDGLTDYEEFALGTDPTDFDSDKDGLPDGYEVIRSFTDPSGGLVDGTENPDNDAMAYTVLEDWKVYPLVSDDGSVTNGYICADADLTIDGEGKIADVTDQNRVYDAWVYGKSVFARGFKYAPADINGKFAAAKLSDKTKVWAIHYDAYNEYGFDPRIGWKWNEEPYSKLQKSEDDYHVPLCTKKFTNLDESLVAAFYIHMNGMDPEDLDFASKDFNLKTFWLKWTTDPLNADTDGDGAPDGWELYVHRGPKDVEEKDPETGDQIVVNHKIYYSTSPFHGEGFDADKDGLSQNGEFSGVLSCAEYADCPTITLLQPEWRNKQWPTDPWNSDTDNDGVGDAAEGKAFIYGSAGVAGGGLNPHSWDTDQDGLPDGWELQFTGTVSNGVATVASTTDSTNSATVAVGIWNNDGMDGTVDDAMLDYDNDGLRNWQEYMVGAMRCWRYDDITSPWTVSSSGDFTSYTDDEWYEVMFNPESPKFNPGLTDTILDPGVYFSCVTNTFDACYGRFYMLADGFYHDLKIDAGDKDKNNMNRWVRNLADPLFQLQMKKLYPTKYISCDPCNYDTDMDGMDDFFELFHGLNPLLGTEDIVANAWGYPKCPLSARFNNYYEGMATIQTRDDKPFRFIGVSDFDFFQFPWLAGLPDADPDGDNRRNQEEALFANVQAASTFLHIDPTPLWMTDSQYEDSLTFRYYQIAQPTWSVTPKMWVPAKMYIEHDGVKYYWKNMPWVEYDKESGMCGIVYTINSWNVFDFMFSFEENEGYDSDHDYLSDFEESQGKTKSASDPQYSDSPLRRQAMWFGGEDDKGFLQTPLAVEEIVPDGGVAEARQNFLYYTVECWAKPDVSTYQKSGLQTLVERAIYTGPANAADLSHLRKNFLLGILDGHWYTRFDSTGTDANQPVEISNGPNATTNWTHLAATYDGKALRLYVNGELLGIQPTSIQPEHGVDAIFINNASEFTGTYELEFAGDRGIGVPEASVLIGASAIDKLGVTFDYQWQTRNLMQYGGPRGINTESYTTIADYGNFYKGYIDEVRIWDGARSYDDIQADYKNRTRYDSKLALANREAVFKVWNEGGSRVIPDSDIDRANMKELPAQLMYHWSFDHVPGAVKAADVMKVPAGFSADLAVVDAKAPWSRPEGWTSFWLDTIKPSLQSTVYNDRAWQPWVVDTISHLPRFDGTVVDSIFWSEDYAGDQSANSFGYQRLAFRRNAEVPSRWTQMLYVKGDLLVANDTRWDMIEATGDEDLKQKYIFTHRNMNTVGGDLMMFGGVFPKRISNAEGGMWDEQGASDAWAQTQTDSDNDGLPDWWAAYAKTQYAAGADVSWKTMVDYYGNRMTAYEAYKRDLAKGMLPDGVYYDEYVDTRDVDLDGIPDWWEDLYGVDTESYTDAVADSDNDGLSNYVEYMLSEIFDLREGGRRLMFNPTTPFSIYPKVSDYFYRLGELYVGEIFTDHDRMSDVIEHKYFDKVSPYLYDAGEDYDGDGWSNYAEIQANTDPTHLGAIGIDEVQINEYPVPTVEISLDYEGTQNVVDKPIVVKAWHDPKLESIPDAVWTIGGTGDTTVNTAGTTNIVNGLKYIGMNPNKELLFHLSPGSIVKGSVKFEYKDTNWLLYNITTGQSYVYDAASAIWGEVLTDREIAGENGKGEIYDKFGDTVVGSIDYITGAVTLDLTKVSDYMVWNGDITGQTTAGTGEELISYYDLTKSYIRVKWNAKPITGGTCTTYYLSDADAPSSAESSLGHLKEGATTFIAFYDLDGDGKYTAGEPYGVDTDVDVGWNYARVNIELSDTHAVSARFNVQDGSNDRAVTYGRESGNLTSDRFAAGLVSGGTFERVRVVRTLIDGVGCSKLNVPNRVVLDKLVNINNEQLYITEADFLKNNGLDIDWDTLADDIKAGNTAGMHITNVAYRVVLGNGSVEAGQTNNLLGIVFTRSFDVNDVYERCKPVALNGGIVVSPSPTFKWYMPHGLNSYTAFEIVIIDDQDNEIWSSGIQPVPARIRDDNGWHYEWKAPIYADDKLPNGFVFKNGVNYTWSIRMLNARYRYGNNWSEDASFRMNVPTNSTDYGTIEVAVRHYGPSIITANAAVRVQAFTTPDFTGVPVAQGYAYDMSDIASTESVSKANARLIGLTSGNYYLRAFVDSNNDGQCQDWETWGCSCIRDLSAGTIYSPKSVQVGPTVGHREVVTLYLDDSDTDHDNLPDAWEYAVYGNLNKAGVTSLDQTLINGVAVRTSLAGAIDAAGELTSGLSVMTMSALCNPRVAALACGVKLTSASSADSSAQALLTAVSTSEIVENSVSITSLALDTENRQVVIGLIGELAGASSLSPATALYSFDVTTDNTVSCTVWRKETLMSSAWIKVNKDPIVVPLSLSESTVRVDLGDDIDLSSGFFKITLEK